MSNDAISPRSVSAVSGAFAPGHLGELTGQMPPELIDDVLETTRRRERRVRLLPSRVVVYLLVAAGFFPDSGWCGVWDRLVAGLPGDRPRPSSAAIRQGLARVGATPLKAIFDLLAGPGATRGAGVWFRGLLVVAVDGTHLMLPDDDRVKKVYPKPKAGPNGEAGYPHARVVALVACGTRHLIGVVFGTMSIGETVWAAGLVQHLHTGMLLLGDRNFPAKALMGQVTATGADFLMRVKTGTTAVKLPVMRRLADGTWISRLGDIEVRVIEADITLTTTSGRTDNDTAEPDGTAPMVRRQQTYRLVTTLLDPAAYPAEALIRLYHERWEVELVYREFKATMLGGRVLRSRTPDGVDQEIYALLIGYQILRTAITDATLTNPNIDPDRGSFTIALTNARDLVILASHLQEHTLVDLVGRIGAAVLANLLPARRTRTSDRAIKCAASKYQAHGTTDRTSRPATITIHILDPTATASPSP